ncbi:bacteriophage abortive infection AbiH family protein [Streptococcus koreensis]|uniref:AbiH family protein n=1 Tax=Streptococcus TaxID=1301 RepID=UPI0039C2C16C
MSENTIENELADTDVINANSSNPKMIIVGNGFDISVGIKSSYNNFVDHLRVEEKLETNEDIYNFNKLFLQKFDGKSLNWNDLESIFENHIKEINEITYNSDDEIRSIYSVTEINAYLKELEDLFSAYLSDFYEKWHNSYRVQRNNKSGLVVNEVYKNIFKDADVINFNYTSTLYDLNLVQTGSVSNQKYFQVHGSLIEKNIIFGGGFTGNEEYSGFNVPGSMDNDKLIRIKKDTYLFEKRTQLIEKINKYQKNSVDTYIMGHSIYGSDLPFLSKIFEKSKRIYLFYFGNDYLIKLQKINKILNTDILEKIVLVPFYDILVKDSKKNLEFGGNNTTSIQLDNNDIELLKRMFNVSLPIIYPFDKFILTNKLFIFNQFQYLKITSILECESLKKILSFLDIKEIYNKKFHVIIDGVGAKTNDRLLLDELFDMKEFTECIKNSESIEITNSSLSIEKLKNLISTTEKCRKIKISNCVIYCNGVENVEIDISQLQTIEYFEMCKNNISEEHIVNIIASKNIISNTLKKIIIRENENIKIDYSLLNFVSNSRYIELDYPENSEFGYDIYFPNVSTFILDAQEVDVDPIITGIILSPKIRCLKLLGVSLSEKTNEIKGETDTYRFSSLFKFDDNNQTDKTQYLSNLTEIEISVFDDSQKLLFDVVPNLRYITYNGEEMSLLNMWVKAQNIQQEANDKKREEIRNIENKKDKDSKDTLGFTYIKYPKIYRGEESIEDNLENTNTKKISFETKNDVFDAILKYISENKLKHSENVDEANYVEAKNIEKEINEFAKTWAVDSQALIFYVLNFDVENKNAKQFGETALKETANYEEFPHKNNKTKLNYKQELNTVIKEFATSLHKKYSL